MQLRSKSVIYEVNDCRGTHVNESSHPKISLVMAAALDRLSAQDKLEPDELGIHP